MHEFGLVDDIVPEPAGGAHWDYQEAAQFLKDKLIPIIKELKEKDPQQRVDERIARYGKMGFWNEL